MNYKRIGRALVCLLLVCCLIVNVSPVKAKAVTASTVALGIALPVGIYACMQALGVRPGSDSTAFYQVVNSCADALSQEWATGGLTQLLGITADGVTKTYANRNFLQAILDWLFGNDIVSSSLYPFSTSVSMTHIQYDSQSTLGPYSLSKPGMIVCFCLPNSGGSRPDLTHSVSAYIVSDQYFVYGSVGASSRSDGLYYDRILQTPVFNPLSVTGAKVMYGNFSDFSASEIFASDSFGTSYDLALESVGTDIETDYETYVATGMTDQDGIPYVPVTIPSLSTDTYVDQTQAQAQAGTTSEAIVEELVGTQTDTDTEAGTITGTGTIADVIAHIKALPQTIADVFADVIAGVKAIPQTIAKALTDAFAISDTFIATKAEALTSKYPYLDTFLALGTDLKAYFLSLGTKPPVIYLDLGAADGLIPWGEDRVKFLDLTWYSAYKPVMDSILGGFLWLWLAWRIFLMIPGLINGASGVAGHMISFNVVSSKKDGGDNV